MLQSNVNLADRNTLRTASIAAYYACIHHITELKKLIPFTMDTTNPPLIMGSGSNLLFANDYPGLIIHNQIPGIECINETADHVIVQVGAGVNWHSFVLYCLANDWYGLENLSLIPGTVGASPIQNIGAYGVEVESCIKSVSAIHLTTGENTTFDHADCEFAYRSSVFKRALKGEYCITTVTFKLSKNPELILSYGAIKSELEKRDIKHPTPKDVSDVVIAIRQTKLPDPNQIPNAGSFFKNPTVDQSVFKAIQLNHPEMPHYAQPDHRVKIPAAWLIESAGLKGIEHNGVGTYDKHALVIINPHHQPGPIVLEFVEHIQQTVQQKFGILLEPEVNIIRS